ncbi:PREDICTED: uncharacterized protein LOC107355866 [Acropora digitifera]|uniref:uncharacterized protein LOC107355866 n=1 Tax=Acropora digitifera TaxID=70779 RepID=UPI00077A0617|nr:PREDICTED: uncharacterized protein LOC107355866 [Acropora digitifera]
MSSTEVREQKRGDSLLSIHSSSLFAGRFVDERRNSTLLLRKYNFVQSSGKKAKTCPYNVNKDCITEDINCLKADAQVDHFPDSKRRFHSARAVLLTYHSSSKVKSSQETLLKLRGSEYVAGSCDLDLKTKIREQSAKRRIDRIMKAEKEKEEQERLAAIEYQRKEEEKKKLRTLRSTTFAVMAMNVSAAGYNFKSFTDKKKWLAEKRMWTRQIVS